MPVIKVSVGANAQVRDDVCQVVRVNGRLVVDVFEVRDRSANTSYFNLLVFKVSFLCCTVVEWLVLLPYSHNVTSTVCVCTVCLWPRPFTLLYVRCPPSGLVR